MNHEIAETFRNRAKIVHNLDKIIDYAKKSNRHTSQMSLFAEDDSYSTIILEEPEDFNPFDYAKRESQVLGISLLYSEYERYEAIRCRYCNSTLEEIFGEEFDGNKTFIAKLSEIEYRTSGFGNAYAKLKFSHEGIESRMYLWGDLYKKKIRESIVDQVYLITAQYNKERGSMDLINFMKADDIVELNAKSIWILVSLKDLLKLKTYLYCHMKGNQYSVNIIIKDKGHVFADIMRCNIDNENLLELRKLGIEIKLR